MSTRNRWDGILIPESDPFHSIVPYVMPKRSEAEVSITSEFDVTELKKYIDKQNKNGKNNYKYFHAICYAIARTIYHRPKMNIFISGRHFYQRKDITLSFVAKQFFGDEAKEILMFMKVKPEMTLDSISHMILGDVKKVRESSSNDLDKTMNFVGNLPRWIKEILFAVLKRLEYHGMYPKDLAYNDPNYSTCLLSNLGSIGSKSCYHHLSDFGTNSVMATIGQAKEVSIVNPKTKKHETRLILDMTITIDERIADGFYFAKSLKVTKHLLENPKLLCERIDAPIPEEVIEGKKATVSKKKTKTKKK